VVEAEKVKVTGAAGAYTRSFENMESGIEEVKGILSRASISNDELAGLARDIDVTGDQLRATTDRMLELDSTLSDTKQAILQGQYNLTSLRQDAERLGQAAADVRDQATRLQEANVVGALTLTQQAKLKSDQAARQVERIAQDVDDSPLYESVKQRGATERLINDVRDRIAERQVNNTNALADITGQIGVLENRVPDLNQAVCDGETSRDRPCDNLCGGAGCGKCGGLSCQEGALTRAQEALQNAKAAEKIFAKKDLDAEGMLNKVSSVHTDVTRAAEEAQAAFDLAAEAKNRSKSEVERVEILSTRINAFLNDGDKATPEQVKGVAYECLNATMTMDTAQIQGLAEQINVAIGQFEILQTFWNFRTPRKSTGN
jgi:coxsackievirus/adenovirus receptor